MSDWADDEAGKIFEDGGWPGNTTSKIASALRAAHKRGKVEGLREAAEIAVFDDGEASSLIRNRAKSLEDTP